MLRSPCRCAAGLAVAAFTAAAIPATAPARVASERINDPQSTKAGAAADKADRSSRGGRNALKVPNSVVAERGPSLALRPNRDLVHRFATGDDGPGWRSQADRDGVPMTAGRPGAVEEHGFATTDLEGRAITGAWLKVRARSAGRIGVRLQARVGAARPRFLGVITGATLADRSYDVSSLVTDQASLDKFRVRYSTFRTGGSRGKYWQDDAVLLLSVDGEDASASKAPRKPGKPGPTATATATPTPTATATPTSSPTATPTSSPTATPTSSPTATPTSSPTATPTTTPAPVTTTVDLRADGDVVHQFTTGDGGSGAASQQRRDQIPMAAYTAGKVEEHDFATTALGGRAVTRATLIVYGRRYDGLGARLSARIGDGAHQLLGSVEQTALQEQSFDVTELVTGQSALDGFRVRYETVGTSGSYWQDDAVLRLELLGTSTEAAAPVDPEPTPTVPAPTPTPTAPAATPTAAPTSTPTPTPTPTAPSGTVLWTDGTASMPLGAAAPLASGSWQDTPWNIYGGGSVSVVSDGRGGKAWRAFGAANQSRDDGYLNQRAEQVPNMQTQNGKTLYIGFDLWANPDLGVSNQWQVIFQSKTGGSQDIYGNVGIAAASQGVNSLRVTGGLNSPEINLGAVPRGTWTRIVLGIRYSTTPGAGWVEVYRDGQQVGSRTPWYATNGNGTQGSTMYPGGGDTGYMKFGLYRGPQPFNADFRFAQMKMGTTLDSVRP